MSESPDTVDRTMNGDKPLDRQDKTDESKTTDAKQHEVVSKKSSVNKCNEETEEQRFDFKFAHNYIQTLILIFI